MLLISVFVVLSVHSELRLAFAKRNIFVSSFENEIRFPKSVFKTDLEKVPFYVGHLHNPHPQRGDKSGIEHPSEKDRDPSSEISILKRFCWYYH